MCFQQKVLLGQSGFTNLEVGNVEGRRVFFFFFEFAEVEIKKLTVG